MLVFCTFITKKDGSKSVTNVNDTSVRANRKIKKASNPRGSNWKPNDKKENKEREAKGVKLVK